MAKNTKNTLTKPQKNTLDAFCKQNDIDVNDRRVKKLEQVARQATRAIGFKVTKDNAWSSLDRVKKNGNGAVMPKTVKDAIDEDDLIAHHRAAQRRAQLRAEILKLMHNYSVLAVMNTCAIILCDAQLPEC